MLARVRNLCDGEHVVLVAIRLRPDAQAIDQLSLALPAIESTASCGSMSNATSATHRRPQLTEGVDISGVQAVSHRSWPSEGSEENADAFGSLVQLVFVVPGSERGAILTIVSNVTNGEDLLERDAEEIAASVCITSTDDA
jgi:hypothetical protein